MAESIPDRRKAFAGPGLIEYRNECWELMPRTRDAATKARDMIAGRLGQALPATVTQAGAEAWLGDLPHKRTMPQRARQKAIAKQWQIKRPVGGSAGPRASARATKLEQPIDAIMHARPGAGFPWADVNDLLLLEGLAFTTTLIDPINWMKGPSLYGKDGKLSAPYADLDLAEARRENEAERDDYMARNLPFRQRAYSIRQCAPIWDGYGALEGLIVKSHWTAPQLRKQGIWVSKDKDGGGAQLYPLGALGEGDSATGVGKQIEVTEAYLCDEDGPYISWCVDGQYTWKENGGKLDPHIIDLTRLGPNKKGALSRLPITWGWGLGWSMADLDDRAMSLIEPFLQSWRGIDALITHAITWSHWRAFPILLEQNESGVPDADDLNLEDDNPKPEPLLPLTLNRVKGKITELGTQGIPPSVFELVGLMLGESKSESFEQGSGNAETGIAMSMAQAFESDALTTVHESALRMAGDSASFIGEGAKVLEEEWGEPVRVYENPDVLLTSESPSDTSKPMVIQSSLMGTNFDFVAVKKKVRGENPAVRQQNAGLVEAKLMSKLTFLQEDGYEAPESELAQIDYETLIESEPGQATKLRILEQYTNDLFIQQLLAAINQGQANQQGLPVGYTQGLAGPPPDQLAASGSLDGGQMPGLGVPDPYQAQLMGTVAGGLGTQALSNIGRAGGELPATPLQLGVPA